MVIRDGWLTGWFAIVITTPDLSPSTLSTPHHQLAGDHPGPWNPNREPYPREKERQSQWQSLQWLIQKIDGYHQGLQKCRGQDVPADLKNWLEKYRSSGKVRKVGLRTLGDILLKNSPIDFDAALCAVIVLHATLNFTKGNQFDGGVKSAFARWKDVRSLTQANREALDYLFEQLNRSYDLLRPDAQPDWPQTLLNTRLEGTGTKFTRPPPYYPPVMNETSLSDPPPYGSQNYDIDVNGWSSPLLSFIPGAEYPTSNPPNKPQPSSPYIPGVSENFVSSSGMGMEYNFQSFSTYPQPRSPNLPYNPSRSYHQFETPIDMADLGQSMSFLNFINFLNGRSVLNLSRISPLTSQ